MRLEQVIQETKRLSANDRAMLAHCLISSLETQHDEGVDTAWSAHAEKRVDEIETGEVQEEVYKAKEQIASGNGIAHEDAKALVLSGLFK